VQKRTDDVDIAAAAVYFARAIAVFAMSDSHSERSSVRVCPHCTTLDIAHVGDTEKSRWLECRECGHVWNHSLAPPPAPARTAGWGADQPRRWTLRDEAERRLEDHRSQPREAAWTRDPGWPRDRWPVGGREESKKYEV